PKPKWGHALVPHLLPYLDQPNLSQLYDFNKDWDHQKNLVPTQTPLQVLICPSAPPGRKDADDRAITDYSAIPAISGPTSDAGGVGVLGLNGHKRRFAQLTDGQSSTVMVAEDAGRPQVWKMGEFDPKCVTAGAWADPANTISVTGFDPKTMTSGGQCAVNCWNDNDPYGFHPAGANFLFADGSVHMLKAGMNKDILSKLVTRHAGEVVFRDEY